MKKTKSKGLWVDEKTQMCIMEDLNNGYDIRRIANKNKVDVGTVILVKKRMVPEIKIGDVVIAPKIEPIELQEHTTTTMTSKYASKYDVEGIIKAYLDNKKISEIVKDFGVSTGMLYNILSEKYGGRDNIPHRRKGKSNDITDEQILDIIEDYERGVINQKEICEKYNISGYDFKDALIQYYGRDVRDMRKSSPKKTTKKTTKATTVKKIDIKPVTPEMIKPDIALQLSVVDFSRPDLFLVKKSTTTHMAGLVSDRHMIVNIDNYIFNGDLTETDLSDFVELENTVREWIKSSSIEEGHTVILYCTGIQAPLAAAIKVMNMEKINLALMHYNPVTEDYDKQVIWDFGNIAEDSYPFGDMEGRVYALNPNIDDVIKTGKGYAITINPHNASSNYQIEWGRREIILLSSVEEGWEIYPELVKLINNKKDEELLSLFFSEINFSANKYTIADGVCKSFNFRNK